jgi:hypothetical protein
MNYDLFAENDLERVFFPGRRINDGLGSQYDTIGDPVLRGMIRERLERERIETERIKVENERKAARLKEREVLPYSDEAAQEICERIAIGELLLNICNDEHLPTMRRCNQWLVAHPDFNALFQSAINDRLNVFEEQIIQIADDMSRDYRTVVKNHQEKRVADPEMVARAKLRIEVRFRHLKAGRPQKWGDQTTIVSKSADLFDPSNLNDEELEKRIAEIEAKDAFLHRAA